MRNTVTDTERVVDDFYQTCFEARDTCPLWEILTTEDRAIASDGGNYTIIKDRVNEFILPLDNDPIPIVDHGKTFLATSEFMQYVIFTQIGRAHV